MKKIKTNSLLSSKIEPIKEMWSKTDQSKRVAEVYKTKIPLNKMGRLHVALSIFVTIIELYKNLRKSGLKERIMIKMNKMNKKLKNWM